MNVAAGLRVLPTCCQFLRRPMTTALIARAEYELERSGDSNDEVVDALVRAFNGTSTNPWWNV